MIKKIFTLIKPALYFSLCFNSLFLFSQNTNCLIKFQKDKTDSKIGIKLFDNVIYLPVSINGNPPVDFVLDTGAPEISIIEKNLASEMKLETDKGGSLKGAGKKQVSFTRLKNVRLNLSDIEITNPRLGAITLTHMEAHWGKPKYGLLGGNILKELVTGIDYINSTLCFHKPENYFYKGTGEKIPIKFIANAILIKAKVKIPGSNKEIEGTFLIDTGVRNSFFNSPFTAKHKLIEKSDKIIENITGFGIGGEGFGKLSRLESIKIGKYTLKKPVVELTTDTKGIAASKRFDGIIGADILSRFDVVFDYTKNEMILEPNENFNKPFLYDMSGIYLIAGNNKKSYRAAYVVKKSPAENAGIKKGDLIIEINGNTVDNYNYEEIKNYLKEAGKEIRIKVKRNNETKMFNIKLSKLL